MKNTQRGFIVPLLLIIIAVLLVGGGAYVLTQKKEASPTVSGNVELPQATSTGQTTTVTTQTTQSTITPPYIKSAQISESIDGPMILYVYGTGFNSSFRVYINEVNGLGTVLMPVSKYAVDNGSNGTSITVVIPSTVDATKQYNVYISNGNTTSNVVTTQSHG